MNLRELLSLKINLTGKTSSQDYSNTEFRRIITIKQVIRDEENDTDTEQFIKAVKIITSGTSASTKQKNSIILVPMKSLSFEEFTFPFSNTAKIHDALKLQVMPYSAAGEVEIFPVVVSKAGRGVSGLVWYVSPEELDYDSGNASNVWPAPLPFVSQLSEYEGNGVTMWIDEENVCSILWQSNKPVLYRWKKLADDDTEAKELSWYDRYCKARELERGGNFVVNITGSDDDDPEAALHFSSIITESVKLCPWISGVNISRTALEGARDLERTVRLMTRASCWLLGLGVIALGAGMLRYYQVQNQVQEIRTRSEQYYRQTFDPSHTGRVANPVTLARDKIAELTGSNTGGHPLEEVLADLGDIFDANKSMNISLDVVRFNSEGIDCTGVGPDMTTILNFRKSWEDKASTAQVDNTQFVSGIGYRFDLRVRW